ncbi:UTP-glucose-1-phosphate uridylyltransferase [Aureococcus anophagefferens]|nr:UTP-glucose-1-phosphate uridylyltransferase [Aureococcus anophagefferens]
MHASGTARRWADSGVEQILFFQDTNALALYACAGCVGVSCDRRLEMNTMSIPRRAKQEMGAIAALDKGGTRVVCNVEYNQLAPLLVAQGGAGDEPDPRTGLSPFPGNTNCFVLDAKKYAAKLAATGGVVPEFANPKFVDESRTAFKKPARLESMMQDYPKLCDGAVGFTSITPWYCYSPVKNAAATAKKNADKGVPPACAASGEADFYRCGAELLKGAGLRHPSFATCYADLAAKLPHPSKIRISARSTLLLSGAGLVVEHLVLDGALQLKAVDDGELVVKRLRVKNKGYELAPLGDDAPEELRIRGFAWAKREQRNITSHAGDKLVVEESRLKAVAAAVMLTP